MSDWCHLDPNQQLRFLKEKGSLPVGTCVCFGPTLAVELAAVQKSQLALITLLIKKICGNPSLNQDSPQLSTWSLQIAQTIKDEHDCKVFWSPLQKNIYILIDVKVDPMQCSSLKKTNIYESEISLCCLLCLIWTLKQKQCDTLSQW